MALALVKRCPACGRENAAATLRCGCGAILAGVDLSEPARRAAEPTAPVLAREAGAAAAVVVEASSATDGDGTSERAVAGTLVACPHADCGQPNPAESSRCVYCHRSLDVPAEPCPAWLAWPWGDREALRGELLVGRVPPASPALIERLERDYDNVSRRHAMLRNVDGELAVEDLGSANGTYVNGVRIAAHRPLRLHPGATIRFGADLTATVGSET